MPDMNSIAAFLREQEIPFRMQGDPDIQITGFSSLSRYKPGTLTWAKTNENYLACEDRDRIALLIAQESVKASGNAIYTEVSKQAFFSVLRHFWGTGETISAPRNLSYIQDGARIGENVSMGIGCYICAEAEIENGVRLGNYVSIECRTHIGRNSRIGSHTVIGSPGFGFYQDAEHRKYRSEHFGGVWIGEGVEIGDGCSVNRGTIDDTKIGDYSAIESRLIVPHNADIGAKCVILGQLSGSCRVGDDSYIAPGVLVKNQINIGRHCMVNMNVLVTEDLPDGYIAHKDRRFKFDYYRMFQY